MNTIRKINDEFAIAGQITLEQLTQIVNEGYKSVLNLRLPDEKGLLDHEQNQVELLGLRYVNLPTLAENLNHQALLQVSQIITELPKPTLIHCDNSKRSMTIVLLYIATKKGLSFEQALQQATKLGLL